MTHVRYIDRTRDYYHSLGYDKAYEWAHFDDVPFTPLAKPLNQSRIALVSTSEISVRGDGEVSLEEEAVGNVYSIPSDTPVDRLYSRQVDYDKHATHLDDVNSYFPITRLQEFAEAGRIGELAARCHGVYQKYSQRRVLENDAPEVLKRCREDGVDAVVLTPV